jgi:hypothetical protein
MPSHKVQTVKMCFEILWELFLFFPETRVVEVCTNVLCGIFHKRVYFQQEKKNVYKHVPQIFDQIWKQYWNDLPNI